MNKKEGCLIDMNLDRMRQRYRDHRMMFVRMDDFYLSCLSNVFVPFSSVPSSLNIMVCVCVCVRVYLNEFVIPFHCVFGSSSYSVAGPEKNIHRIQYSRSKKVDLKFHPYQLKWLRSSPSFSISLSLSHTHAHPISSSLE